MFNAHVYRYHQYGFNLDVSNKHALATDQPDIRSDECKALPLPPAAAMPKVSVIIIFFNEPLSTLLRNVVAVLNRTPPNLLGEVLLVDDFSSLPQLALLEEHLDRLPALARRKVRLFKRTTHNGIVGARNRGAKEAVHDIIVFLDSHSEVTPGWLPPLVSRIHGDRTRVVIPALHPIGLDTLRVSGYGNGWPPSKGSFNWKLGFTIVPADVAADVIPINGSKRAGAVRTPVMPGGLFAMDRAFFFEIGDDVGYDPEILYYGAEHVELSFRVWMCGGTMENIPCSHVGHVYRNFDRFAVDPSLENVDVGKALNRNDMRVAEVWLDEYKALFYQARGLAGKPFGDISKRVAMRKRLQCKSFEWYLKNVHPEQYIPELDPVQTGMVGAPNKKLCLDSMQRKFGPIGLYGCHGWGNQRWNLGKKGLHP